MALITLSGITKSFGTRNLFQDVSFYINERERVALVGANGTGKTTLLRIICGENTADTGTVNKDLSVNIGYLPQEVDLPDDASLLIAVMGVTQQIHDCAIELAKLESQIAHATGDEAHRLGTEYAEVSHKFDGLRGFEYQIEARAILQGLGFLESEFDTPVHALSGGQKTRAALARLLLLAPDILLLDEPTNHLDIQACDWLQGYINDRFQGAALIVSHDRYFLDHVVSKVVEIENCTASTYPGNYSTYANLKSERIEEQRKLYKLQQKEIARIESAIQTLFSNRKFSRRDNKVKQLERINRIGPPSEQRGIKTHIASASRSGREVIRLEGLSKRFPGKALFDGMDLLIERGKKVGIVGPNGSGKTTLLRIIAGRIEADEGEVIFGHNVQAVYFAQEFDHLVPNRTVIEELLADTDLTSGQARDLLAQFLFMGDDSFKRVEVLSGGEMCRLALAKVLATSPNLLLLDEPTNHLDIRSREALEEALKSFDGTVIVCSHDRYLLDAVADEILEIKDTNWTKYLGNYSDYRSKTEPAPVVVPTVTVKKSNAPQISSRRPDSPLKAIQRRSRELERLQKETETGIETTETRMAGITESLADEETYRNGTAGDLSKEYDGLTSELAHLYEQWEQICEEMSELEAQAAEL